MPRARRVHHLCLRAPVDGFVVQDGAKSTCDTHRTKPIVGGTLRPSVRAVLSAVGADITDRQPSAERGRSCLPQLSTTGAYPYWDDVRRRIRADFIRPQ